jgi:hypothetical protein
MKNFRWLVFFILTLSLLQLGMGRREGQYDEEAREAERQERLLRKAEKKERGNPLRNMAGGVKQATYDSTTDLVSESTEGVEGVNRGTGKVLDNTVKGVSKVASLGFSEVENYEVSEPEKGSDEPTKIKFKIPGT